MLRVSWELPAERGIYLAWLASRFPPPGRAPQLVRVADGIAYYEAAYARAAYADALQSFVELNLICRAAGWRGELYESGARYARECCGEVWRSWPILRLVRKADCEDLAAARVSELVESGADARILLSQVGQRGAARDWHVRVWVEGRIEDPAAILGMHDAPSCDPIGPRGAPCAAPGSVRA